MVKTTTQEANRRRIFASLALLKEFVDKELDSASTFDVEVRSEQLDDMAIEFKTIDAYLVSNGAESDYLRFQNQYFEIKSAFRAFLRQHVQHNLKEQNNPNETLLVNLVDRQSTLLETINRTSGHAQHARPPKIEVPTFDGDYRNWPAFKDLFTSCVGSRTDLSDSIKLQFLKSSVKGEASKLISYLYISDANYGQAWDKLMNRYDKRKHIVSAYIKEFISQPNCSNNITSIRRLADTSDQLIRGIDVLGTEATVRSPWLIYIVLNKLDDDTRKAWAEESSLIDFPSFDFFLKFLNKRCDAFETLDPVKKERTQHVRNHHLQTIRCIKCDGAHQLYKCSQFKSLPIFDRRKFVKEKSLCFNCLLSGHPSNKCKSRSKCHTCNKSHHTTLHITDYTPPASQPATTMPHTSDSGTSSSSLSFQPGFSQFNRQDNLNSSHVTAHTLTQSLHNIVVLPTAVVHVLDVNDQVQPCRILLDSGSQASFISEECANRLALTRERSRISVHGLSSTKPVFTRGTMSLMLMSRYQPHNAIGIKAHVLDKLTAPQPQRTVNITSYHLFKQYPLADPEFYKSRKIDLIVGADQFSKLIVDGKLHISPNLPPLQQNIHLIDNTLKQFWAIEELPTSLKTYTEEESYCENQFRNTHYVDEYTNRYVVRLPLKNEIVLGQSLNRAISCLQSQQRRINKNPQLSNEYSRFMTEYKNLHHMEIIPTDKLCHYVEHMYLPHHAVIKPTSTTTKVRVVFNGSAITTNGISLNQKLLVGPKTQRDLINILLAFRTFKIAVIADVEKMYRQVLVHPDDRKFQRIVWRENSSEPVSHFLLNTVTYGTSSAPFLATRALKQLTEEFKNEYPLAEDAIKNHFYVDGLLGGAENVEQALKLHEQLTTMLSKRKFSLRKWCSNSPQFLAALKHECVEEDSLIIDETTETLRVLGLKWIPTTDHFSFEVSLTENAIPTKRVILSEFSRVFDPLGLITPVTIVFKIMFQKLWLQKCDWDECNQEISDHWIKLRNSLQLLNKLRIPRFLRTNTVQVELHGFSDASELAYAAVIYARATDTFNNTTVRLVMSKTKVTPIKQLSVPRLELCAAVLLTKLFNFVLQDINVSLNKCFAWTDSTIVLAWLSDHPRKWKCFVANRTSFILSHLPISHWAHVKSNDNPADVASRGLSPQQLIDSSLWWTGPTWLTHDWSKQRKGTHKSIKAHEALQSEKREHYIEILHLRTDNDTFIHLFTNFSTLSFIIQILIKCFKFIRLCRKSLRQHEEPAHYFTNIDVNNAYNGLCKWSQTRMFHAELRDLQTNGKVKPSSILSTLTSFIDKNGLLRVGGRLDKSHILYNAKHPIILPKDDIFVKYLITHVHQKHLHANVSLVLNTLRQDYWIISCRRMVKSIINKCMTCAKHRGQTSQQLMANLPIDRLGAMRAFEVVGVDYAGPLELLNRRGRGARVVKGYIAFPYG